MQWNMKKFREEKIEEKNERENSPQCHLLAIKNPTTITTGPNLDHGISCTS